MEFTIRNPHETALTPEVMQALGVQFATDSSGQAAPVYELDGEAEADAIRAKGLIVERVSTPGASRPS